MVKIPETSKISQYTRNALIDADADIIMRHMYYLQNKTVGLVVGRILHSNKGNKESEPHKNRILKNYQHRLILLQCEPGK